jgi:hypothetical protein
MREPLRSLPNSCTNFGSTDRSEESGTNARDNLPVTFERVYVALGNAAAQNAIDILQASGSVMENSI